MAVAAACLLVPAGASAADVTIGSNLAGAANVNICSQGISCTYVQTSSGTPVAVSPLAGQVVRWRLKAGSLGGEVKLRVLRPTGTGYAALTSSTTVTVASELNTFTTSLPIAAGAGSNSFRFTGRVANRKLAKGRYRLIATPSAGGKTGSPVRAPFRIK